MVSLCGMTKVIMEIHLVHAISTDSHENDKNISLTIMAELYG